MAIDSVTKQIGIRISERMNKQLEAIAKREQNGIAAVCRRLLVDALEAHERREGKHSMIDRGTSGQRTEAVDHVPS